MNIKFQNNNVLPLAKNIFISSLLTTTIFSETKQNFALCDLKENINLCCVHLHGEYQRKLSNILP